MLQCKLRGFPWSLLPLKTATSLRDLSSSLTHEDRNNSCWKQRVKIKFKFAYDHSKQFGVWLNHV